MSYTVVNQDVFTAAYTGALAGMAQANAGGSSSYTAVAAAAGAFAQSFDTGWSSTKVPTTLEMKQIALQAERSWLGQFLPAVAVQATASTYDTLTAQLIAIARAGSAYYTAQGIANPTAAVSDSTVAAKQTSWFINGTTGDDSRDGLTTATSIKTWAELGRRWNGLELNPGGATTTVAAGSNGASLPQATINVASTTPAGQTAFASSGTIFVLNSAGALQTITYTGITATTFTGCSGGTGTLATGARVLTNRILVTAETGNTAADPVTFNVRFGLALGLVFKCTATTNITPGGAGTLSGVTARDRSANVAWLLTDSGLASFSAYLPATGATPARIYNVTKNFYCFPTDAPGANQVHITEPLTPLDAFTSDFATTTTASRPTAPATSDTYQLQALGDLFLGDMIIAGASSSSQNLTTAGVNCIVAFQDARLRRTNNGNPYITAPSNVVISTYGCIWHTIVAGPPGSLTNLENCLASRGLNCVYANIHLQGGGLVSRTTDRYTMNMGLASFDFDCIIQSGIFSFFNTPTRFGTVGVRNMNGDGIVVRGFGQFGIGLGGGDSTWNVWGSGNSGYGINTTGSAALLVDANVTGSGITVTGTSGDFALNSAATATPWDASTNTYVTPDRACTWANFFAAVGSAGFGGSANNVPRKIAIVQQA